MGHTVPPMRWIIYEKMRQLKRMIAGMREPEKSIAESLLSYVHLHISSISFSNPLPSSIEQSMIFAMLVEQKKKHGTGIDDLTLLLFSLMVRHHGNSIVTASGFKTPDERDVHRLLQETR